MLGLDRMTDPNDLTTIAPEFNDPPALAFFDLVASASTTHKSRYALRVAGLDAEGVMRCLVLTWDGTWHPASPTTGNILRRAFDFQAGDKVVHGGRELAKLNAFRPEAPSDTMWFDKNTKGTVTIYAGEMLEVLP